MNNRDRGNILITHFCCPREIYNSAACNIL